MKRSKTERTEAIIETVLEILFTVIGLGVGFVVYSLLGIDVGDHTNYDGLILVGLIAFFAFLIGIGAIINLIKKKTGKDGEEIREKQDH